MADYAELTFGSLAYDPFGTAAPQIDFPPEPEEPRPAAVPRPEARPTPRQRVRVRTEEEARAEAQARVRGRILAAFAVPAAAVCVVLLVLLLQSYSRLTALSDESARLESRISALKEERSRLEIACESAFNMEEVEQTAHTVIGMVKADTDQVIYLRSTAEDVAVILEPGRTEKPLLEKAADAVRRFLRFLGQG